MNTPLTWCPGEKIKWWSSPTNTNDVVHLLWFEGFVKVDGCVFPLFRFSGHETWAHNVLVLVNTDKLTYVNVVRGFDLDSRSNGPLRPSSLLRPSHVAYKMSPRDVMCCKRLLEDVVDHMR